MVGRRVREDVLADPVVYLHGLCDVLPVGLEPDVERGPPRGELALPDELPLSLGDLPVALESASFDDAVADLGAVASVVHGERDGVVGGDRRRVEAPAVLAYGRVGKDGLVL